MPSTIPACPPPSRPHASCRIQRRPAGRSPLLAFPSGRAGHANRLAHLHQVPTP